MLPRLGNMKKQQTEPTLDLHPAIAPVASLIGTWRGSGQGYYPTIEDFSYTESITFAALPGKPFLRYLQVTLGADGTPMHTESGFLRPLPDVGRAEFTLAQPTGQTELAEGTLAINEDGTIALDLGPSTVANSETAKQVDSTRRTYQLTADGQLHTALYMAAVGVPMTQHLHSTLERDAQN